MTGNTESLNAEQKRFWNEEGGREWVRNQDTLDAWLATFSDAALAAASPQPGEVALDVGCGCGGTSLALAERGLEVTGVDLSGPMLELARERAGAVGAAARFIEADAGAAHFDPAFDLVFSRFGVMFFGDPVAAFSNLRGALKPDGRLAFICWQSTIANTWISAPMAAIREFLPPAEPPDPRAPGPFAFADPDWVREILGGAGFTDVAVDGFETPWSFGTGLDDAIDFYEHVGPLSRIFSSLDPEARTGASAALRACLETGLESGLRAACWIVTAR